MSNFRRLIVRGATLALFGVLIASFALWGIGDIFRSGGGGRVVATVGDEEVTAAEFQRQLRRQINQLRQRMGGQFDMEMARQMGVIERITRQAVTRALFNAEAAELGLAVGDEDVAKRIRQQQVFQSGGNFNRERFQRVLQQGGLSEAQYVEQVRGQLKRRAISDVISAGVAVPDIMAESEYRYRNQARVARYLTLATDSFEVAEPTADELKAYYEEHGDAFTAPAYRELTYIHAAPADITERVKVSDAAIERAYAERKDRYSQPAQRRVRQIVFDDEETARRALGLLMQGRTLEAVSREIKGGAPAKLGMVTKDELPDGLAGPVFELKEGRVTEPVQTSLGWHLAQVTEVQPATTKSLAEVRDEIRADLARDKAADRLISMANDMRDALAGGAPLKEVAQQFGFELRRIPAVDQQGRNRDGEQIKGLPAPNQFLQVAFNTTQGQRSLLEETDQGGYFVLRVDSVTPSQRRPFDAVKDKVRRRVLAERRAQAAEEAAKSMVERVNGGAALAGLAADRGVRVRTSTALTRTDNENAPAVEKALTDKLFAKDQGKAFMRALDGRVAVATVSEVREADPQASPSALESLRQELGRGLRSDLFAQFADSLRQRHTVRVNQGAIDQIVSQVR
ncbi:peptidyl-prolyl cis-trans isomerase D [Limimonas halophila]|uniref:Parvulin-like PPIase n=1 Tax=Limimonas halophila TaxID=1082479 RepID=A0A1G7NB19_9PROT|nr:SurA N-terminal domain-containing protein [Limimonas halophila]SDF71156.1 peptidyl-prolyl cis-trans isomerase D [Limimonas halophila]